MNRIADLSSYDITSPYGISLTAYDMAREGKAVEIQLTPTDLAFLTCGMIDKYGLDKVRRMVDRIAQDDPTGQRVGLSAPAKDPTGKRPPESRMTMDLSELYPRLEPTSEHSVTVYDRDRTEPNAQVIGTVNAGPHGVEAFRPHYSLAGRSSARVPGSGEFANIGDGVLALVADYESRQS